MICGSACNRVFSHFRSPGLFFIFFISSQLVILYSQVENSSTAQVGGPQDAVGEAVPVLAGSDIPLPEDGFAHEVIISLPHS